MRFLGASRIILLGLALSSSAFAEEAKLFTQAANEIGSFTVAANSGGGGVGSGRGVFDRARGFDRARERQRDTNPSSGFGRDEDGLGAPSTDMEYSGNPNYQDRRALE